MGIGNIIALAGGLGLFLYGMRVMGEGLEMAAGNKLKKLLEILTKNRFLGVIVGIVVTAIIQSSSATTVMVVGFVNAGLLELSQTIGIIMGANIGTTVTSVLIALKLDKIAPIAVFLGAVLIMFFKNKKFQSFGGIFIGFGMLFVGLSTMSTAMEPLQNFQPFLDFMVSFQNNPLLCVLIGAVVTAVIQSSSASIGILQALALQNLIGIRGAIFILCGQNIGTCVTALLAAVGTNKTAKRTAVIHLLFNVIGSIIFILIVLFTPFTDWISLIQGGTVAQIAASHLLFNILATLVMFPFAKYLASLACRISPGEDPKREPLRLEFLDSRILMTPAIAVAQVVKEVDRMANLARSTINLAMETIRTKDTASIETVRNNEQVLNYLNHNITEYLVKINALELQDEDSKLTGSLFHVVNDLERIGDHAENIIENVEDCISKSIDLSDDAMNELQDICKNALIVLDGALEMLKKQKFDKEQSVYIFNVEEIIDNQTDDCKKMHVARLNERKCTAEAGMIFINLLANLERVSDHATNIAYAVEDTQ